MTRGSQPVKLKHLWKMLQLLRNLGRWAFLVHHSLPQEYQGQTALRGEQRGSWALGFTSLRSPDRTWGLPGLSPGQSAFVLQSSCKMDPGHRHLQWMDEWGRLWSKWWQKPCLHRKKISAKTLTDEVKTLFFSPEPLAQVSEQSSLEIVGWHLPQFFNLSGEQPEFGPTGQEGGNYKKRKALPLTFTN